MRLPTTLLAVMATATSLLAEAPPVQGTLPEDFLPALKPLLKQAVESSPTTIASNIALAQQEAGKYLQSAALWPSINANSSYQVTTESLSQGQPSTAKGLQYNASIYQPVFQWGALKNQAQIGALGVKVAERQFADAYRTLAVTIRDQYMGLIIKKIALRNARFQQKIAEEALATQKAKFEAGAVSESEVQGYSMNLDDAALFADRAEEELRNAKQLFIRLVGVKELSDEQIPMEIPHPEYQTSLADTVLAGFVGSGVESTFQSEVYRMYIEQQEKSYAIAKVRLLPKLVANANVSYSNFSSVSPTSITQIGVREESYNIAANWSIFDGFSTRGSKLSALASKRQYELARQNYIDSTIDQISYMRHQLGFASRAMSSAEVHNALIAAEVKRLGDDKDLGYASQATIEAGIVNLNATQFNMAYARYDYLNRWSNFISLANVDPVLSNVSSRYVR